MVCLDVALIPSHGVIDILICTLSSSRSVDMASLQRLQEPNDPESIQKSFARHLEYSLACTRFKFTMQELLCLLFRTGLKVLKHLTAIGNGSHLRMF